MADYLTTSEEYELLATLRKGGVGTLALLERKGGGYVLGSGFMQISRSGTDYYSWRAIDAREYASRPSAVAAWAAELDACLGTCA